MYVGIRDNDTSTSRQVCSLARLDKTCTPLPCTCILGFYCTFRGFIGAVDPDVPLRNGAVSTTPIFW